MQTTQIKPVRKLTNIDFSGEDSHIALVHRDQGGPANGADFHLLLKSSLGMSEQVQKAIQQVKITMQLPDFLEQFFWLCEEESSALAVLMGYVEPETPETEKQEAMSYLEEKIGTIEIMKQLHKSEDISADISKLDEKQLFALAKDQSVIEKAMRKKQRLDKKNLLANANKEGETEAVVKAKVSGVSNAKVEPSGNNMEKSMDIVNLQKALDEQSVALQKATAEIELFKQREQERIIKDKLGLITAVIKDDTQAEILAKAGFKLDDADFSKYVDVIKALGTQIEKSALFQEQGASQTQEPNEDSLVAKILKAQFATK